MGKRNSQGFADFITGVFMLAVLALLAYFTIVISGVDLLSGRQTVSVRVAFDRVGGLKARDSVMYRGTKVGTVDRIDLTPSNLVVTAEVDRRVLLREGCSAAICSLSLLGGNYLVLDEGEGEPIDPEARVLAGTEPTDWMRDFSEIAQNLNRVVNGYQMQGIISNVHRISEDVLAIADRIERGEGTVGRLLSSDDAIYRSLDRTIANAEDVSREARETATNVNAIVARVQRGEGMIGRLTTEDDPLYAEVKASVASFKAACESFNVGEDAKVEAQEIVAGARRMVASLEAVSARMERGEGTLGKLMNDDRLYNEVNGVIRDARQVLDNYRDTTPISTFSSLVTGAL